MCDNNILGHRVGCMGKKLKKRGKRKSEQKLTPKMEVIQSTSSSAHSPMDSAEEDGKTWFDSSPSLDTHFTVATELDTPVKPANKRSKREKTEMSPTLKVAWTF